MTDETTPPAAPELDALLARARDDVATDAELGDVEARVIAALGPGGGGGGGGSAEPGGSSIARWGVAAMGVAAAIVAGVILLSTTQEAVVPAVETREPPPPIEPPPAASEAAPAPPSEPAAEAPPPPRPESGLSETELLDRARAALPGAPARALALAREHARRFPRGELAQEREVITIDALLRLGRSEPAAERARRFRERFPSSAHRRRIDTLLTRHGVQID